MIRKILAGSVLLIGLSTGTAAAQDSPGPSVAPEVQVRGDTVLPKTGSDIGVDVIAGVSLTAAGVALAAAARQRRRRIEAVPAAS